jgi:hypothetical protein
MSDVDDHVDDVEAVQEPTDAPADPEPSPVADDATEAVRDPEGRERSEEAKRYRLRLREAEGHVAERDEVITGLRAEVDRLHRAEAERLAGQLQTPADLWLVADLADLRDDDGRLDAEKVTAKVAEVVADHPAWRRRSPTFDGGARRNTPVERTPGLADLLKPERTRS